ncbi:hypothetical protein PRK78_005056 [Emydomyces testavorans]|uniref:C2H2-type domain-containing protein n=1 Tax=Emydomyces testavorans TaxID=2070801 RepID=A0AAF0DJ41_9EURO|nr:hypothetical protein PRK78_005056 [Emydomyces testavorans]
MADVSAAPTAGERRGWDQGPSLPKPSHSRPGGSHSLGVMAESPKKHKRSKKGDSDRKFECKHEGCGKSYSRAEHLYRHQLNRMAAKYYFPSPWWRIAAELRIEIADDATDNPKRIYRCEFPNCTRAFVRQDLCIRHQERHNTHGSQLQKRDSFAAHSVKTAAAPHPVSSDALPSPVTALPAPTESTASPNRTHTQFSQSPTSTSNSAFANTPNYSTPSSSSASLEPGYGTASDCQRKSGDGNSLLTAPPGPRQSVAVYEPLHRPAYRIYGNNPYQTVAFTASDMSGASNVSASVQPRHLSVPGHTSHPNSFMSLPSMINENTTSSDYIPHQNLQISPLSPHDYGDTHLGAATAASLATAISSGLGTIDPVSGAAMSDLDTMTSYALPVFGGETLNRSPFAMTDDFTAWLFNEPNSSSIGHSSLSGMWSSSSDPFVGQLQSHYFPADPAFSGYYAHVIQQQHPMSVTSILDTSPPQSVISEEKRVELLDLMQTHFNESDQSAVKKRKESLFEGDMDTDSHALSLQTMQTYVGSYWYHCHDQLPILHKPTFTPDKAPNLLLLAVMALGAATSEKEHGQSAADFAHFVAWHLRWEIFRDSDFRPPAKLWIFQTLLLLETYEKMFSTRALHERAHIHHDTTLTLMRRGSSLIGRSAFDSPPSLRDDPQHASGTNPATEAAPGEDSWVRWIKAEATRRVAFAAFVLDTIHATMFGHSAKMVAHELRLPLPCEEALWSATSAADVAKVQSNLASNEAKPIMFLAALKKTLNGQKVFTNSFGRTVIMAGLLSVSWHMNQRDLQVSSLGVPQTLGGRDKWRSALLRAFDNWKRDFDEALVASKPPSNMLYRNSLTLDGDVFFESRTVLHHLAHMASHVDVVDCQIFAGASRLLGRSITPRDYSSAREKMTDRWVTKPAARDAAFYALKFLSQVLIPDRGRPPRCGYPAYLNSTEYCARSDFLLNRPWVLYFAALVIWCYGYALDGPIRAPVPELGSAADQRQDMYEYLSRVGGVVSPDDLEKVQDRNRCMGLLMVLRETFSNTRWELLQEAANLLSSCIEKLKAPANGAGPSGHTSTCLLPNL